MEPGKQYIVTKGSDDGTFEVGDHIYLEPTGELVCVEAMGWMDKEYVQEATVGMEVVLDSEWVDARRSKLKAELEAINRQTTI